MWRYQRREPDRQGTASLGWTPHKNRRLKNIYIQPRTSVGTTIWSTQDPTHSLPTPKAARMARFPTRPWERGCTSRAYFVLVFFRFPASGTTSDIVLHYVQRYLLENSAKPSSAKSSKWNTIESHRKYEKSFNKSKLAALCKQTGSPNRKLNSFILPGPNLLCGFKHPSAAKA